MGDFRLESCPSCGGVVQVLKNQADSVTCRHCGKECPVPPPPPPLPSVCSPSSTLSRKSSRKSLLVATIVVMVGAVAIFFSFGTGGFTTDPDLRAVRDYLKNNLNSPNWEEVQWWPARPCNLPDSYLGKCKLCRLKYRENNGPLWVMHDDIFAIENGQLERLPFSRKKIIFMMGWKKWYGEENK